MRTTSRVDAHSSTTWNEGGTKSSRMILNSENFFNCKKPSQMNFAKICFKDNKSFRNIFLQFGMSRSKVSHHWRSARMPNLMRLRRIQKSKGFLSWDMLNQVVSKAFTSPLKFWIFFLLRLWPQQFQQWQEWSDQNQSSTKKTKTPTKPSLSLKITLKT